MKYFAFWEFANDSKWDISVSRDTNQLTCWHISSIISSCKIGGKEYRCNPKNHSIYEIFLSDLICKTVIVFQYRLSTDLDVGTRVSLSSKNGVGVANFVLALQKVVNNQCIISANFSLNDIQFHPLDNRPIAQPACIHCWEPLEPQFDRFAEFLYCIN